MRFLSRKKRWLALGLAVTIGAFLAIRTWVVPWIIVREIRAQYGGRVVVKGWWLGLHSAGVTGVELGETDAPDSPTWLAADRISTDVSLARLIRGHLMPTRVVVEKPRVTYRLDPKGQPLTKIPTAAKPAAQVAKKPFEASSLPELVATGGEITLAQEGRKPMTIRGVDARLAPVADGAQVTVTTDDPDWGKVTVDGHFDPTFKNARFDLATGPGFVADPARLEQLPFIPAEVWANVQPRGPVDARVRIDLAADSPKPVSVHTDITLKGMSAKLNSLQVESTDTTGHILIDDTKVRIQDLQGKAVDGSIAANGSLDFGGKVPVVDLDLRLKGVDVTKTPPAWQLGETGATGRLSGRVDLKVALDPAGPDLTGTAGRAVIEDGSFQGIPIKSMNLGLKADGNDLQYETLPAGSVDKDHLEQPTPVAAAPAGTAGPRSARKDEPAPMQVEIWEPIIAALPLVELASHNQGLFGWTAYALTEFVAYQAKRAPNHKGGLRLPKTITTNIELEDVELATLVAKAKRFGIEVPIPVAGRFSIKATATIPLGSLKEIRAYAFRGDASLKGASIDHVDLGLVSAHLELVDGILDLSDFRGQFVDRPAGDDKNPPRATGIVPATGTLPPGAFRGRVRAAISPRGAATAHLEGVDLPLGELLAPVLPNPSPLSGVLTIRVDAGADLGRLADPKALTLDGHVDSRRIRYQGAVLDRVAAVVAVRGGRLDVSDFSARLLNRPLKARGGLDLAAPYHYDGHLTVEGWQIAEILGFVPGIPRPSPASGVVDARGDATGSLQPFAIVTQGDARGGRGQGWAEPDRQPGLPLGDRPRDRLDHRAGAARLRRPDHRRGEDPDQAGPAGRGDREPEGDRRRPAVVDVPRQGADRRRQGRRRVRLTMPVDASTVDADAELTAPDLRIRQGTGEGASVKALRVKAVARDGLLDYDATAEGLGGKVRFHGSSPVAGDLAKAVARGEILAVGFRLGDVWKGLGMAGGVSHLEGSGRSTPTSAPPSGRSTSTGGGSSSSAISITRA